MACTSFAGLAIAIAAEAIRGLFNSVV